MQKGTGFYKFVSVCCFIMAAVFSVCFAAGALAWILLIVASKMFEGGLLAAANAGCLMILSILMGIIMLQIHAGCILWDSGKRDNVVYTIHQVAEVLLLFTKLCMGIVGQYLLPKYLFLWIAYDVFMLTTSILGLVAFTKKKKVKASPQPSPEEKRIGILAVEGDYQGNFFPMLSGEKLVLGTSLQNSHILFHDPKISRQHCMVEYIPEQKMYYITDHSTNGTFLGDGRRIPENTPYPCAPMTRFYFGKTRQMFELV